MRSFTAETRHFLTADQAEKVSNQRKKKPRQGTITLCPVHAKRCSAGCTNKIERVPIECYESVPKDDISLFGLNDVSKDELGQRPVVVDSPEGTNWLRKLVENDIRANHLLNIEEAESVLVNGVDLTLSRTHQYFRKHRLLPLVRLSVISIKHDDLKETVQQHGTAIAEYTAAKAKEDEVHEERRKAAPEVAVKLDFAIHGDGEIATTQPVSPMSTASSNEVKVQAKKDEAKVAAKNVPAKVSTLRLLLEVFCAVVTAAILFPPLVVPIVIIRCEYMN